MKTYISFHAIFFFVVVFYLCQKKFDRPKKKRVLKIKKKWHDGRYVGNEGKPLHIFLRSQCLN